jgi:hypothetical protein
MRLHYIVRRQKKSQSRDGARESEVADTSLGVCLRYRSNLSILFLPLGILFILLVFVILIPIPILILFPLFLSYHPYQPRSVKITRLLLEIPRIMTFSRLQSILLEFRIGRIVERAAVASRLVQFAVYPFLLTFRGRNCPKRSSGEARRIRDSASPPAQFQGY